MEDGHGVLLHVGVRVCRGRKSDGWWELSVSDGQPEGLLLRADARADAAHVLRADGRRELRADVSGDELRADGGAVAVADGTAVVAANFDVRVSVGSVLR